MQRMADIMAKKTPRGGSITTRPGVTGGSARTVAQVAV
jgi:hypothetical protein